MQQSANCQISEFGKKSNVKDLPSELPTVYKFDFGIQDWCTGDFCKIQLREISRNFNCINCKCVNELLISQFLSVHLFKLNKNLNKQYLVHLFRQSKFCMQCDCGRWKVFQTRPKHLLRQVGRCLRQVGLAASAA